MRAAQSKVSLGEVREEDGAPSPFLENAEQGNGSPSPPEPWDITWPRAQLGLEESRKCLLLAVISVLHSGLLQKKQSKTPLFLSG